MPTKPVQRPPVKRSAPASQRPANGHQQPATNQPGHNPPVDKVRMFPVEAAIWQRYTQDGRAVYSATFQRSYKDQQGAWQRTTSFNGSDLLVLAECARAAYQRIQDIKAEDSANQQPQTQPQGYQGRDEDVPF